VTRGRIVRGGVVPPRLATEQAADPKLALDVALTLVGEQPKHLD
jgi:hypothetical protein